ncbi:hypothetical protein H2200_000362 [Cladophialophora chaetospira]|uniref:Transcription factor domain-containing protein n=1 Tax=Cladophialophora chaetospira TaxID=386627 RepID=A0AA39CQV5_9EURO|nr:hypothetical protein H2200_000362 [Cladophialophora chaetospira]
MPDRLFASGMHAISAVYNELRFRSQKRKPNHKSGVSRLEQKLGGVAAILAASDTIGQTPPSIRGYIDQFIESEDEAQLMLDVFRNELMPHFPFVVVAPGVTVTNMKRERPFLFLAVMMMACRHDIPKQGSIAKAIRDVISQRILIKNEQSLDLLEGMLFYLSWYHVHLHLGTQLTNLLHLVMALMVDLRLHRQAALRKCAKPQREYFRMEGHGDTVAARTLEQRRTFLGCYYLTAVIAMTARDFEPVRYTRYAEECCQVILEAAEYPTDIYLVQVVKLLKPSVSPHTLQNMLLLIHYYSIETYLCEIALDDKVETSRYGSFSTTRLSLLFACLRSAKHFFESFYAIPATIYFDLPYSTWTLYSHLSVVLSKLSLCVVDGWDHNYVSETLNFDTVLDRFSANVGEAVQIAARSRDETVSSSSLPRSAPLIFLTIDTKIKEIRAVQEAKRADLTRRSQAGDIPSEQAQLYIDGEFPAMPEDFNMMDSLEFFEFVDEPFWTQI